MAELNAPARSAALLEDRIDWRTHAGVVSWGAVFAGAVAAAAFGLILLTLGTGLGLAALSPWHSASETAHTFGVAAIVWVCVTQILTSGLGGYLAGRLRHRWPAVEVDEVYFRDTAHGFLTWALATLATAALFAAILPAVGRAGLQAGSKAASSAVIVDRGDADAAVSRWPIGYYIDALFRMPASAPAGSSTMQPPIAPAATAPGAAAAPSTVSVAPPSGATSSATRANAGNTAAGSVVTPVATPQVAATASPGPSAAGAEPSATGAPPKREVTRIFLNSLATGDPLSGDDTEYVATIVSRYTGLAPQAAQARVGATYAQLQQKTEALQNAAKAAADRARRASISAALWLFVSLLMGAFAASFMAIFGGRLRDV